MDYSDKFTTSDGTPITPNLRVFGYDMMWGNVDPGNWNQQRGSFHPDGEGFDGWYTVVWDDTSRSSANGTRMAHKTPLSTDPTPNKQIGECDECGFVGKHWDTCSNR